LKLKSEDVKKHMADMAAAIKKFVAESIDGLSERVKALELREIPTAVEIAKHVVVENGKDGRDGKDGNDGGKGADGINGKDGTNGKDGKDGEKGGDGINGKDGNDGKDALELEIMPAIDAEKSYPRGTYASHNNGLWRAYQRTDEMKGWECIVAGVASLDIQQVSERGISIKSVLSDGKIIERSVEIPALIYRGVFMPGGYSPGDAVTWAGSLWHCNEITSDKPGETGSKGWTLAVKKGRDGKDGKDGKDLVSGVQINASKP
jgi:hypothetical protein